MANIQETLNTLQPYVIGIRYVEKMVVVDVVFKEEWNIPEDPNIKKIKGDKEVNYYMLYSETEGVGLDELLGYVSKVISLNLEREEKHKLLIVKINQLKELFKKNNLNKLMRLKFIMEEEHMLPMLTDIDDDVSEEEIEESSAITITEIIETMDQKELPKQPAVYLDENKQPIPLTEEDLEIIEEEKRAELNRKILAEKKQQTGVAKIASKVELPKRKIQEAITDQNQTCACGEEQACPKCIDRKGY